MKAGRAATAVVAVLISSGVVAQGISMPFAHTIRPRGFAEECFSLGGGETIGYGFVSSAVVDFNIHFHRGDGIVYPVRADAIQRASDRFTAPSAQEFCLMWTNRTPAPVTVTGTLSR